MKYEIREEKRGADIDLRSDAEANALAEGLLERNLKSWR